MKQNTNVSLFVRALIDEENIIKPFEMYDDQKGLRFPRASLNTWSKTGRTWIIRLTKNIDATHADLILMI